MAWFAAMVFAALSSGPGAVVFAAGETTTPKPTPTSAPAAPAAGGPASAAPASSSASAASSGDKFRVNGTDNEGLRVRAAPSLTATILARLPEGAVITLSEGVATEADNERWLPIQTGTTQGWAAARYLSRVVALASITRTLAPGAAFGDRAAAIALSAIGQPYVWAGNSLGGFDCSGFVQWVYTQAGVNMARQIPDQLAMGTKIDMSGKVDPAALRPGDLLAFTDTYRSGLSHVGVYLGDNLFGHAADEAHGVSVSNILDDYWRVRFYRAVRIR